MCSKVKEKRKKIKGPDKTLNAGIIGFGLSGKVFHAPFLDKHPGFNLKKIVERHQQHTKEIYPYIMVVNNFNDLLNDQEIDLVVICTPNTSHYLIAKQCLMAGKHIVIEKPFTPTSKEADELIRIAESKNLNLFVYHNRRWDNDFLTVKKVLEAELLGDISEYEVHFDRYKPEIIIGAWRDEKKPGGGILFDLGSHLIDQALHLFGFPDSISADIRIQREGSKVDDYFDLMLHYPAFNATLKAGMLVKEPGPRFILHGSKGSFLKYGIDPQENALKNGLTPDAENWGEEDRKQWGYLTIDDNGLQQDKRIQTLPGCYQCFYDNVYDVLAKGGEMAIKPDEARDVIRIIEIAFESTLQNKPISFNQ